MRGKGKIIASIEARMTSSRLPGKVLMPAIGEVSMLELMLKRLEKSKLIDEVVVATTLNETDNPIETLCNKLNVKCYRGSEPDVLHRVLHAHKFMSTDIIVELTGDCPLIDSVITDNIISYYLDNSFDYVSNAHVRSYPDGFDVQVFSYGLLEEVELKTSSQFDRENVSSFIYSSGLYSTKAIIAEGDLKWPELRVTLDDVGDYKLIVNIIEGLFEKYSYYFSADHVVSYIKENPEILQLLEGVRITKNDFQKQVK